MNSNDPQKKEAFNTLFPCLWGLLEATPSTPAHPNRLFHAKGIVVKIARQICSVCALLHPLPVPMQPESVKVTDPISVSVIARSILESYVVWERIFIVSKDDDEKQFWYLAWALKSLKLRTELPPPVPDMELDQEDPKTHNIVKMKAIDVYNNMKALVKELETLLAANPYYKRVMDSGDKTTKDKVQDAARNGWKTSPEFLVKQSMKYLHTSNTHAFLNATAHLDHIDIRQIVMSVTHEEKKQYAETALTVILVVMARLCEQFPLVFPESLPVTQKDAIQAWIQAYKEVADR